MEFFINPIIERIPIIEVLIIEDLLYLLHFDFHLLGECKAKVEANPNVEAEMYKSLFKI